MGLEQRPQSDPARRLQWLATLALAAIACLAVGSYVLYTRALRSTQHDAPAIAAAGNQRVLTHRLTEMALQVQVAAQRGVQAFVNAELRGTLEEWERVHVGLQQGDPEQQLAPNINPEVTRIFAEVEPDHAAIVTAVNNLLAVTTLTSREQMTEAAEREVLAILDRTEHFVDAMDRIALLYEQDARTGVQRVQRVTLTLTLLTLLALLLEGLLIFRPAVRLIRRQFRDQQALAEEARKLALVASRTGDGVLIADAEATPEWVNDAFTRLTGYGLEDLRENGPAALLSGAEVAAEEFEGLRQRLVLGQAVRLELRHRRRNGTTYWGDIECVPVLDAEGKLRQFIAIERDITDRKYAEEEVRRTSEELAAARDVALASARTKAEFLANMSHEIRTPMNGVIGMVGLLLDTPLTEEQRDYALTVRNSADALLAVINDILDFSKIEAGKLTIETVPFDLEAVLEEVSDLLAARAFEKQLEFACVVPPEVPRGLRGDPSRLRQILVNLVGNAIKFTERGEVVIETSVDSETATEVRLRIGVRDTGIGIPPHRLAAVFESFTQVDGSTTRKFGGTGLGLTISRQLAQIMGGEVVVDSVVGEGSTFSIVLPLEKATAELGPRPHAPMSLEGRRILIVDDHPVNRLALAGQLRGWGMVPVEAVGGREALALLRSDGHPPVALAILDMQMPDMDGEDTAAAIKADPRLRDLPLVLLSSTGSRFATPEGMRAKGFEAALVKPVRASRLFNTIADVFGVDPRRSHREPTHERTAGSRIRPGLRVLLAEDNLVNKTVAVRLLEKWGCAVDAVGDGQAAVEAASRKAYDVILMDVQMPELDGYEATARIRAREEPEDRHTPIIAMTAHAMQGDEDRCLAAGMDDYVAKPVKPALLEEALVRWAGELTTRDLSVLDTERLGEFCGVDARFRCEVVTDFLDLAPDLLSRIEASLASQDLTSVITASRALRSSAQTLGGLALGAVCQELTAFGTAGVLDGADKVLDRARRELTRLRRALVPYLEVGEAQPPTSS